MTGIKWIFSAVIAVMFIMGIGSVEHFKVDAHAKKTIRTKGPKKLLSPGIGPFFSWLGVQKRMQK